MQNPYKRQPQNPHIKSKRSPLEVLCVQSDLVGYRQIVPAVNLRPTRKAWYQFVNTRVSTQRDKFILIEKGWARTDKTHITFEDAPQLRQFVEACLAQKRTDGR